MELSLRQNSSSAGVGGLSGITRLSSILMLALLLFSPISICTRFRLGNKRHVFWPFAGVSAHVKAREAPMLVYIVPALIVGGCVQTIAQVLDARLVSPRPPPPRHLNS